MCGIAGYQFAPGFNPSTAYKTTLLGLLALGMDKRGGDSYGTARINSKGEVVLWKGLGEAIGKLDVPKAAASNQLILHTRRRTHGAISIPNAHPLHHGHILGTHNGIVSNHESLNRKYERDFDLDSRHIFEHLSKGLDVSEIGVYGAISYIDLNHPNVINLCRLSTQGDLAVFGVGSDKQNPRGVIYASTPDPIVTALKILGEDYFEYDAIPPKRRYYIKDGMFFVDRSKGGELPFGEHVFYNGVTTHHSYGPKRPAGYLSGCSTTQKEDADSDEHLWPVPPGMKICKRCRKRRRRMKEEFSANLLCQVCWQQFSKFWDRTYEMGADSEEKEEKKTIGYCVPCFDSGLRNEASFQRGSIGVCSMHARAALEQGENITEKKSSSQKPDGSSLSLVRTPRSASIVLPAELDQWDLCNWCAADIKASGKFTRASLCVGCSKEFDDMLASYKKLSDTVRAQFFPVLFCTTCYKVPTFGWLRSLAYTDDGVCVVKCRSCGNRCTQCKEWSPKLIYSAYRGGLVPYCPKCNEGRLDNGAVMPWEGGIYSGYSDEQETKSDLFAEGGGGDQDAPPVM